MKTTSFWFMMVVIVGAVLITVALVRNPLPRESMLQHKAIGEVSRSGVCPPFVLRTETGDTINPVTGQNANQPYSPKQTCGMCHDYELITQGYHFQQGKDESPTPQQQARIQWASSPGNYGGSWCSPAPLYPYLSSKQNEHESLIDMTSYTFVNKCGVCHPGGGPLEYDRDNIRYDEKMNDPYGHYTEGGKNDLDGDYYKANWQKSGVVEADCFICHLPDYDNKNRVAQIQKFNYRYAALAGSGYGTVSGSVAEKTPVSVAYHAEKFNADGTVEPFIVKEPRNTACLFCHAKPGYKKRGADFRPRNDVHLQAGLKCVDCHPAGSMATDDRIRGREVHQIAKGDDPGGLVRNDLDNTMRTCADCHDKGYLGAPKAVHAWLPPVHLDRIACQTCHIPQRNVKSVHFVAGDVFNPGTKIPTKGKHLWTFYGPDMHYWNHYGDLEMMGYDDKPTFTFEPELVKYKDMIYPANRVHTAWPAIQIEGQPGLMQPKMGDIYQMWTAHFTNPEAYPELSMIRDDNGDEVIEVNRSEEIDAVIGAISRKLADSRYPMQGKRVVWVMNNRIYTSGNTYQEIPAEVWEASPYGNVHTYNHDIFPANSALGMNGCTECHSYKASFFMAPVVAEPMGASGDPAFEPQYKTLAVPGLQVHTGIVRESYLKPLLYIFLLVTLISLIIVVSRYYLRNMVSGPALNWLSAALFLGLSLVMVLTVPDKQLAVFMLPSRSLLDGNHFLVAAIIVIIAVILFIVNLQRYGQGNASAGLNSGLNRFFTVSLVIVLVSGLLMVAQVGWIFYTLFDLGLLMALGASVVVISELIFEGKTA